MTPANVIEAGVQTGTIGLGQMKEFQTLKGAIQVIGTKGGFAVRLRDETYGPDTQYNADCEAASLTIRNPNQPEIKLEAFEVVDFQESPELDG